MSNITKIPHKMPVGQRREWLLQYIRARHPREGVDVLNRYFVDDYADATSAKVEIMMWGANRCPQLGRDLLSMYKVGQLERGRIGLAGNWQPGFPKWVWSYRVKKG